MIDIDTENFEDQEFRGEITRSMEKHEKTVYDTTLFMARLMGNRRVAQLIADLVEIKDHHLYRIRTGDANAQIALVRSDSLDKVIEYLKTYFKEEYHDKIEEFGDDRYGGIMVSLHICEMDDYDDEKCVDGYIDGNIDCEHYETTTFSFEIVDHWTEEDCQYNIIGKVVGLDVTPQNAYCDLTKQEMEQ